MPLFALFKGDSKSGKTVGAISFPEPVIVLDFDKKGSAIADKHFPGRDIEFQTFDKATEALDLVKSWKHSCKYNTIVVDTVTSLSALILWTCDWISDQGIAKYLQAVRDKTVKMGEFRSFNHYKVEDAFLKEFLDDLKTIWIKKQNYILVNAHVLTKEEEDIKTKQVTRTRRLVTAGRAIAAYIPAQFDEAWHFGVGPGEVDLDHSGTKPRIAHFCVTEAIGNDYASTAFNLPYEIDFTNSSLYDKVRGEIDKAQRTTQTETQSKSAKSTLQLN